MSAPQADVKNIFGTDGVRDRAGEGFLAIESVQRLAQAVQRVMGGEGARVLIGRDSRDSGPSIEQQLASVWESGGWGVDLGGLLPTPAVSLLTATGDYQLGVVISASHNPPEYNGIKLLNAKGCKLDVATERAISAEYAQLDPGEFAPASAAERSDLGEAYRDRVLADFGGAPFLSGMKIVLDCARGATATVAPEIYRRAGAEVFALFDQPDGQLINDGCGSLHPETLQAKVLEVGADLGVAFDGDGDRAILVDDRGEVVDGDDTMALWAVGLRDAGDLSGGRIVATIMSNAGMESYLRQEGIGIERTPVGDREVFEALVEHDLTLGGEQSGHVIFTPEANTGDGIRTGLHLARLVHSKGARLSELRKPIPRFPQELLAVPVDTQPPLDSLPAVVEAQRVAEGALGDEGRIVLRYSGTEPIARVLVEGPDPTVVQAEAERIAAAIRDSL